MTIKHEIPALKQVQQMLKANQASINGELEELNRQWYALRDKANIHLAEVNIMRCCARELLNPAA